MPLLPWPTGCVAPAYGSLHQYGKKGAAYTCDDGTSCGGRSLACSAHSPALVVPASRYDARLSHPLWPYLLLMTFAMPSLACSAQNSLLLVPALPYDGCVAPAVATPLVDYVHHAVPGVFSGQLRLVGAGLAVRWSLGAPTVTPPHTDDVYHAVVLNVCGVGFLAEVLRKMVECAA